MSIVLDYLPNRENIKIYQDDEMFRINSDTFALGEFLEVYRDDVVMDVGTNNGALLLYASTFHPKKMIGIDINNDALELAKKNLELNNIENYELINCDFLQYNQFYQFGKPRLYYNFLDLLNFFQLGVHSRLLPLFYYFLLIL